MPTHMKGKSQGQQSLKRRKSPPDQWLQDQPKRLAKDWQHMQQAYGNKAVERMMLSMLEGAHPAQGISLIIAKAVSDLGSPYAEVVEKMVVEAESQGKMKLLERFIPLTSVQKQAVLRSLGWTKVLFTEERILESDWQRLEQQIQLIEGVRLEEEEGQEYAEADVNDAGEDVVVHTANVTGLLQPYRELAEWLNYKANKQGEADKLKAFDSLSIPQKMLALHTMAQFNKLKFKSFTDMMTVYSKQRKWVDWDRFSKAIAEARQVKQDKLSEVLLRSLSEEKSDEGTEMEMDLDLGLDAGWLGLLLAVETEEDESEAERDTTPGLGALSLVLSIIPGLLESSEAPAAVSALFITHKETMVNQYLKVPAHLPANKLKETRQKMMAKQGFQSIEQVYKRMLEELADIIFEKGVLSDDATCMRWIERLGLKRIQGKMPSKAMLLKQMQ